MKKPVKKLRLTRDSLRRLTSAESAFALGGTVTIATENTDLQNSCGSVCYTDKMCGIVAVD